MSRSVARGIMSIHGMLTNTYHVWRGMRSRCENPNGPDFPSYGGRGIRVCSRWQDFKAFHADMGERPTIGHSIDRIDNDGNYQPDNCRWATRSQQSRNRRSSPYVLHDGKVMHLADAAEAVGITYHQAINKVYRGRPFDAKSIPVRHLNEREAGEIKWLIVNTDYTNRQIANNYGCSDGLVCKIRHGKQWISASPVEESVPLPTYVPAISSAYIIAIADWKSALEVMAVLPYYSKGLLQRLVKAGLAERNKGNNTYRALPDALSKAKSQQEGETE